jgi:hypothetical protein
MKVTGQGLKWVPCKASSLSAVPVETNGRPVDPLYVPKMRYHHVNFKQTSGQGENDRQERLKLSDHEMMELSGEECNSELGAHMYKKYMKDWK